jgi:Zn finger protein HypA/HybF involved in hydrogenase expression
LTCDKPFAIERELTPCPICGGYQTKIISGEEFFLDSIEIEKNPEVGN